jgi:hypothetical protein
MENLGHHILLLNRGFAEPNMGWLKRFVRRIHDDPPVYAFTCAEYSGLNEPMVNFEVLVPGLAKPQHVFLPLAAIAGVVADLEEERAFGFSPGDIS